MMRRLLFQFTAITLALSLMALGGCIGGRTEPAKFYVLTSVSSSETERQVPSANRNVAIGVGPVELPWYLDRQEIVTRSTGHELHLAEFDLWAEPLKQNLSRVLAENLSILLSTYHVVIFPWEKSRRIAYQVAVKVTRFERDADGNVTLDARWSLIGANGKEVLVARKSAFSEAASPGDYEATVSAMSRTLSDLSREIAAEINAVSQKAPAR